MILTPEGDNYITMKKYLYFGGMLAALVSFIILISPFEKAQANPSNIYGVQTAAATTSLVYMTAGTATTTLTLDNYIGNVLPGNYINTNQPAVSGGVSDSVTALIQFTASTSGSILKVRPEISQDGIDWYPYNTPLATISTTTPIAGYSDYQWTVATTSANGLPGTSNAMKQLNSLTITNVPTRYIRLIFTIPIGSSNGALWSEAWVKRQQFQ